LHIDALLLKEVLFVQRILEIWSVWVILRRTANHVMCLLPSLFSHPRIFFVMKSSLNEHQGAAQKDNLQAIYRNGMAYLETFRTKKQRYLPSLRPISLYQCSAEVLVVKPLEEVCVWQGRWSSTAHWKGSRCEHGQISHVSLSSDVLHTADSGVAAALEL
jgi:hypothetical protein